MMMYVRGQTALRWKAGLQTTQLYIEGKLKTLKQIVDEQTEHSQESLLSGGPNPAQSINIINDNFSNQLSAECT